MAWANYSTTNWANGQHKTVLLPPQIPFQITGVQIEVGENASDFEHRSYGEELGRMSGYYSGKEISNSGLAWYYSNK